MASFSGTYSGLSNPMREEGKVDIFKQNPVSFDVDLKREININTVNTGVDCGR